jgi:hypothetical protein
MKPWKKAERKPRIGAREERAANSITGVPEEEIKRIKLMLQSPDRHTRTRGKVELNRLRTGNAMHRLDSPNAEDRITAMRELLKLGASEKTRLNIVSAMANTIGRELDLETTREMLINLREYLHETNNIDYKTKNTVISNLEKVVLGEGDEKIKSSAQKMIIWIQKKYE